MIFNDHSNLKGRHATFSPSQPSWLGYTKEQAADRMISSWSTSIGTVVHELARSLINERIKFMKSDRKMLKHYLLDNKTQPIPRYIVDEIDIDSMSLNLSAYVNDAIGFRMTPELILRYSDLFFGTADTLSFDNRVLRIHDLKTGRIQAKIEQLEVYAALFCLEYNIKPIDISTELRIYQGCEVLVHNPTPSEIMDVGNQIVMLDNSMRNGMLGGNLYA